MNLRIDSPDNHPSSCIISNAVERSTRPNRTCILRVLGQSKSKIGTYLTLLHVEIPSFHLSAQGRLLVSVGLILILQWAAVNRYAALGARTFLPHNFEGDYPICFTTNIIKELLNLLLYLPACLLPCCLL